MSVNASNRLPKMHKSFLLNNDSFNEESLFNHASNLIKEGKDYEKDLGTFLLDWLNNDLFIYINTSGSTGVPKKIKVLKEHMVNSAKTTGAFFKTKENSKALLCLSANYIAGKMMIVRAIVLGWHIDVVAPKSNPLKGISKQYDFSAMVPLQLSNSMNELYLLKKLIVGGGAIPQHLVALVQNKGTEIYETYGMTETVSHIAARKITFKKEVESSFFKIMPNVNISTDDRNCLVIEAPLLSNEILTTNDIVEINSNNDFIWKGRFDNVINSGGVKLFPEQIEKKLQLIINQRFFITSEEDEKLGNRLILVVEDDLQDRDKKILLTKIVQTPNLDKYEIPKEVYFLKNFIETSSGKVHREQNKQEALSKNK